MCNYILPSYFTLIQAVNEYNYFSKSHKHKTERHPSEKLTNNNENIGLI